MFLAVADGHGSPRSFRSQQGAALAVEEAERQWSTLSPQEPLPGVKRWLDTSLPARLAAGWRAAVWTHAERLPLAGEERSRYEAAYHAPPPEELPLALYGTTLLTAAVRPGYLALAGVGDGEALLLDEEGRALRPLGEDPRHLANETTSLASPDAARDVRTAFQALLDRPPALLLLSTDGYPNCFEAPGYFEEAARELLDRLRRRGVDWVAERLPGWLQEASRAGSGDDTTVALLVREDLVDHSARRGESLKASASMAAILRNIR
jgi:serine/threonine protein phosphatase PrpC